MTLSRQQLSELKICYTKVSAVLDKLLEKEDAALERSTVFELSAAVGVLRTLLNKHNQPTEPCT